MNEAEVGLVVLLVKLGEDVVSEIMKALAAAREGKNPLEALAAERVAQIEPGLKLKAAWDAVKAANP
jgi:hypothetical protein